ncbi:MAG: caspase family protein, partial [Myxococcota bacterium]
MPAIVVTLALALSSPAHAQQELQRYALLVGDNDGGPSRVQLRYAHDDAAEMASVLTELGGVRDDQQQLLLDPTAASLDAAFADLAAKLADGAGARAEFVFYYSGHSDEQGLLLGDERYEYRALRARLEGMPARVRIAILDSCASGALILEKGGKPVEPFLVDESTQVGGLAYLTSSSADEAAQEAERIGGSFFTHYLASGLRGAADSSGDGRVTLYEAYSYAHQETLEHTETTQNGPQHAWYSNRLSGTGELVLTDLALTSASLVLDEALDGRALIRDADGNLVVELQKVAGRPIELGLAEGHYSVTLLSGPESYGEAQVELTTGASTLVQANELVWQASEVAVARGNLPPGAVPPVVMPPIAVVAPVEPPLDDNWFRFVVAPGMPAAARP